MEEKSAIAEFYRGKSVFVTGGTGFVGKVLVEKLLYSCPAIDKIFILVRDRNGSDFEKRFKNLYQDPLFDRLKIERPHCFNKVVPVLGDLSADNLISNIQDVNRLIEEVSVVFHVAATIRFNEPLNVAMTINVDGTKKVLQLSRQMKKLNVLISSNEALRIIMIELHVQAVVHVSTAFMNPMAKVFEEKFYPFPIKTEDVYAKLSGKKLTAKEEEEVLAGWPNTYIFTKALTESIIAEEYKDLPLVIVRPSIVTALEGAPLPGWVDNWAGATAILYPIAMGYDRVLCGRPEFGTDLIPVDYVSNCIIIAATTANRETSAIYNICTTGCNTLTLETMSSEVIDNFVKNEYNDFPCPYFIYTESLFVENIVHTFIWILSLLGDLSSKLWNKTPRYVKAHSKIVSVHEVLRFFTNRRWMMKCDATRSMYQTLSPVDQEVFLCDPTMINWKSYLSSYCAGIQEYLVKKTKKKSV